MSSTAPDLPENVHSYTLKHAYVDVFSGAARPAVDVGAGGREGLFAG